MHNISRRHFVRCSALVAPAFAAACGGENSAEPPTSVEDGVEILGDVIRVQLTLATSLNKPGGSLVVPEVRVIIIRAGDSDFRAFSNICTHAGCGIYAFVHPRIKCQCHGSEFDMSGGNVVGPAILPLSRYETILRNNQILEINLSRTTRAVS